jgi:eukaryotic-like serine/threonine-protein kinase
LGPRPKMGIMSNDATSSPPPSTLIGGKYALLGLIGRGGMGSVYEGRHASLGTPVAIKFIDAEYAGSQDARSRFDTEARAAATIQSKHAIQIYDHGVTDDGRPYIVMELLIGESLDARIRRLGTVPLEETARIVRQVARALTRAHERGIVHRDLKPENIFLVKGPDDDEEIAKVLDFGIAKIKTTPGAVGVSSSTKTGTLLGTPFFMSPEQARGLRSVDHRTDVWSLGVIVFKCVTGALPFDGESLGDLLVKICTSPIPMPSERVPTSGSVGGHPQAPGAELDHWMLRALEREPDLRFQSATELADALGTLAGLSFRRGMASTPDPGFASASSSRPIFPPVSSGRGVPSSGAAPSAPRTDRNAQVPTPFGAQSFSEPIPAATSAPITASAPSAAPRSPMVGVFAAAAFGLLLGLFGVGYWRLSATKGPPASGIAIGASTPTPADSAPQTSPSANAKAAPATTAAETQPAVAPSHASSSSTGAATATAPADSAVTANPTPPASRTSKPAPKPPTKPKTTPVTAGTFAAAPAPLPPAGPASLPTTPPAPKPAPANPSAAEPGY